jgi:hypothetical protein
MPTLTAMSAWVTIGPPADRLLAVRWAARRGEGVVPPAVLAWSGHRIPTGPNVMQSGQIPRPHSEQET